jgi:hypothetical protein
MSERGRGDLSKRRAQGAIRVGRAGGGIQLDAGDADDMAEFVNHGAMLCRKEHEQEA